MTRWQYITLTSSWSRSKGWDYTVSDPWELVYEPQLERCTKAQRNEPVLDQLGQDGWELVSIRDVRRDQFVTGSGTNARVFGRSTVVSSVFKRPLDVSTEEITQQAYQLAANVKSEAGEAEAVETTYYQGGNGQLYCSNHRVSGCGKCRPPVGYQRKGGRWVRCEEPSSEF